MTGATDRNEAPEARRRVRLFLSGDVMTGRGIDQILPHPSPPEVYEPYVSSARDYVRLAEQRNGAIPQPVDPAYVWGTALEELDRAAPDARIINLETSITRSDTWLPKGINYRMSPENAGVLTAAGIDCCVLANNHVLDWGQAGLVETLETLERLGIATTGAGRDAAGAARPAIIELAGGGRIVVLARATPSSGTPRNWAAGTDAAGINLLPHLGEEAVASVTVDVERARQPGDIVVVSLHWGSNWGYEISDAQARFARSLIDEAGVAIVHGHSSHHPKAIEVHHGRPILYGCGDFVNDYEGIRGYESYHGDLVLMYLVDLDAVSGELLDLELVPLQLRRFQLGWPSYDDAAWLRTRLDRECRRRGTHIEASEEAGRTRFALRWQHAGPVMPEKRR